MMNDGVGADRAECTIARDRWRRSARRGGSETRTRDGARVGKGVLRLSYAAARGRCTGLPLTEELVVIGRGGRHRLVVAARREDGEKSR